MNTFRSRIEFVLNVVIAAAIAVVAVVTVLRYLSPRTAAPHEHGEARSLVGTRMTVPAASGVAGRNSLVLFMRKDCPACKMAAPLYRELTAEASKRGVRRVVLLPDSLEEGKQYLRSIDLEADHVQSADLSSYKISAVPTIVVVDGRGVVQGAWVGVSPGHENETRRELIALLEKKS